MVQDLPATENKNIDDGFSRDVLPVMVENTFLIFRQAFNRKS